MYIHICKYIYIYIYTNKYTRIHTPRAYEDSSDKAILLCLPANGGLIRFNIADEIAGRNLHVARTIIWMYG